MTGDDDPVVFVVDDDPGVREAITSLMASAGVQAEGFPSAYAFLRHRRREAPACLVLDVRLPGLSGLELQRELVRAGDKIPIVFITGQGDVPMSVQAMKAGALEFLMKPFRERQLLDAVQEGLARDRQARAKLSEQRALSARYQSLTPREREVMGFVVAGLLNKQIAATLGTSEITVKVHRAQVMQKMKADSLADLVRISERLRGEGH